MPAYSVRTPNECSVAMNATTAAMRRAAASRPQSLADTDNLQDTYAAKRRKEEEREERRRKRREAAFDAGGGMTMLTAEESRRRAARTDPRKAAQRAAAGLHPAREVSRKI